ncbi:MAG: hypothetical protein SOW78_10080 [Clostridia bacterium]|nr:hypothetical protein [Clostridia bacterium]
MKHIKRIISLCLILSICISGIQVSADNIYTEQSLEIESVSGTEVYKVLNIDNRTYMSASDFGKITRYQYKESSDSVQYTLGNKLVSVSKKKGKLSLPMQNYSAKCSKTVSYNGNTYIAMDEMLPWLNVECSIADNKLIVTSDAVSIWELTNVLTNNFKTYKFNLYEDLGGTKASSVGLAAAMLFDTIVNVRFDKLIPVGDSIFDPDGSLYDRNCYRDLYIDMATEDALISSQAEKVIKKVFEINGNIGTIEEAFGVDAKEISQYGDSYLAEFGIDEEHSNKLDFLTNDWLEAREALNGAYKASKYFNPFKILKSYETALHTTNEYRDYLKDITYDDKQNNVMQTAVREASLRLDESKGAVISAFIDLGYELVVGKTEDTYKKIIEIAFDGKSWSSMFLYLDLANIFYSTIVPVTDGMSEMSKFIIYSNVSDYSWDKACEYAGKELTQNNIAFMCQSYMASLKSSKKAFEGMQTLFDSKAFGFSMFGNNDGLMNHRIEPAEKMLAQLALTSSCRENDSTDNKEKKKKKIKELLKKIQFNTTRNTDNKNHDLKQYGGTWYGYGTDSAENVTGEVPLTFLSEKEILLCDEKYILIDRDTALSESCYEDSSGQPVLKSLLTFGKDSNGELALESYEIRTTTGKYDWQKPGGQNSQSMCFYRQSTRGNYQDFVRLGSKERTLSVLRNSKKVWQDFGRMPDIPESEVIIHSVNDDSVRFSLELYRTDGFENINGTLRDDGRIYFKNISGAVTGSISGYIDVYGYLNRMFEYTRISVCITDSTHPYVEQNYKFNFDNNADKALLNDSATIQKTKTMSESEAQEKLEKWLGDLGTWVAGEDNVLVCDGIYNCNGKEYYQFRLRGWVYDHSTTLTWYVISVDGSEMFEGQCSNGYLEKF